MSLDTLVGAWKEVRSGLMDEAALIPADQFGFRATPDTRSVAELLQHIISTQKLLGGELSRPDSNLGRAPFPELIKEYAPDVMAAAAKDDLMSLLKSSIEEAESRIRSFGDEALQTMTRRFDGKELSKYDFLMFAVSHEMYHRGQLTVFERLLHLDPALTTRFRKLFGAGE